MELTPVKHGLTEGEDFELVPVLVVNEQTGKMDDQAWRIRILKGDFTETLIEFGTIKVSEDGEHLNFDFNVVESPIEGLTSENTDLQSTAGLVLLGILEDNAMEAAKDGGESPQDL
jgi:hypothetical protein